MFKISEELKVLNLFASTIVVNDTNGLGTGIDVESYEDDALVILQTGLISSTSATYAINVQASTALAGTYTTIGSFTTVGSASDYAVAAIPVNIGGTDRKYVRLQVDVTGTDTVAGLIGATLVVRPTVAQSGLNSAAVA